MTLIEAVYLMFAILGGAVTLLVLTVITRADQIGENWERCGARLLQCACSLSAGFLVPMLLLIWYTPEADLLQDRFIGVLAFLMFTLVLGVYAFFFVLLIASTIFEPHEPTQSEYVRDRLRERRERKHR